jgi:RNA polymerase sigma factor (sigma-70 family)
MTQEDEESRSVSLLAIDQYMRGLRWSERLTVEEEARMVERVERGKRERMNERSNQWVMSLAKHAFERLVEGYQPYVSVVARKLAARCRGMELLDLIQEGNIALMGAIESHDPARGYPLRTLVGVRVRGAMLHALGEMNGTVRVCWRSRKAVVEALQASEELRVVLGREPSYPEVAARLRWTLERVVEVMDWRWYGQVQSLQGLLKEDEAEDYRDFVGMFHASVQAEASRSGELEQAVQHAIETALTDRQREVVSARYGFGDGIAQEGSYPEIAAQFGVSAASVHVTDVRAKKRLQVALAPVVDGSDWGLSA